MIARRASALLLSIILSSPAAAQVRAIPVEAGTAPLAVGPAGTQSSSFAPSLTATTFAASLSAAPVVSAPSAPAALTPSIAAAAASSFAPAAGAAAALAKPAAASPALSPAAAEALTTFAAPSAAASTFGPSAKNFSRSMPLPAAAAAPVDLDALFDGGSALKPLAAAAGGAEFAPRSSAAPLPAPSRLRRALRVAAVAVPAVVLVAAAGAFTPHAALLAVHWLGQAAYWLANPFAFMFTIPQIYKMLSRRSADVSAGMIGIGIAATATATLNFAFDGKDLMTDRNLVQMLGFAVMLALKWRYARKPGQAPPSKRRALVEAGAAALAILGVMFAAGPALLAAIPGIALMGALLVPLQVASGFGFTYLMYVQLSKMLHAHSAGDSSPAMMWAYLGTKTIWVWSLATMVSLATAPAWIVLPAAAVFAAVCWWAGSAALTRLLKAPWAFLPQRVHLLGGSLPRERMVDVAAFVALSVLILALSAAGYFAFVGLLGVPAVAASRFAMYLLYMVQSLVASLATLKTLRLAAGLRPKDPKH